MSLLDTLDLRAKLRLCVQASLVAYDIDEVAAKREFEALGLRYVGLVHTPERWAYVCEWNDVNLIVYQGTRFSRDFDVWEVADDLRLLPVTSPLGPLVPDGFATPLNAIRKRVCALTDPAKPTALTGHSLGGESALLEAPYYQRSRCYPIANPTGASKPYLDLITANCSELVPLVHERDFAHGYGVGWHWHQPLPFLWLRQGKLLECHGRGGINISEPDHSCEGYLAALDALPPTIS